MDNVSNMDFGGVLARAEYESATARCATRIARLGHLVGASTASDSEVAAYKRAGNGPSYDGGDLRDRMSDVEAFTARYAISTHFCESVYDDEHITTFRVCAREREGLHCVMAEGYALDKNEATVVSFIEMLDLVDVFVFAQMDGPTGETTQTSDVQENTIVTSDGPVVEASAPSDLIKIMSEPDFDFPSLMNRWVAIKEFGINATWKGETIELPRGLYKVIEKTPNLAPFRNFVYSQPHIELMIVVNGYKMCVGKVIAGVMHDPYMVEGLVNAAVLLQREHVVLDCSNVSEGILDIPFRFHRNAVRNLSSRANASNETGYSSRVDIQALSAFLAGPGSPGEIRATVMARFKSTAFNAMTYALPVAEVGRSTIHKLIGGAEALLDILPIPLDKPADPTRTFVIPSGRAQFATGKGVSGAQPLRMDPTRLTPYGMIGPFPDDPKNAFQLARKWGIRSVFSWGTTDSVGANLHTLIIDPTTRAYSKGFESQTLTPLETAASMFNFWAGTIEFELQFVSNSFHTGAVIVSAEFGRSVAPGSLDEIASCYTKTFQLGEQRVMNFTVPYLYDTPMRRSNQPFITHINQGDAVDDTMRGFAIAVGHRSFTRLRVTVLNAFVPIAAVPQMIEVLVFMRAGKDFTFQSLKPNEFFYPGYQPIQRSIPFAQMDSDPTAVFDGTTAGARVNFADEHDQFLDILKRPVMLFEGLKLPSSTTAKATSFYLPIMPMSRQWHMAYDLQPFVPKSLQSPSASILNLFRFWRGSIRFHIFARGEGRGNIYATLIPHTGVVFVGERNINQVDRIKREPHHSGLMTEVGVLSVNTSMEVECPYDTENPWTLMWANASMANVKGRDAGDLCAGHLALHCTSPDVEVDIWISCGDDFMFANFVGPDLLSSYTYDCMWYDGDSAPPEKNELPAAPSQDPTVQTARETEKAAQLEKDRVEAARQAAREAEEMQAARDAALLARSIPHVSTFTHDWEQKITDEEDDSVTIPNYNITSSQSVQGSVNGKPASILNMVVAPEVKMAAHAHALSRFNKHYEAYLDALRQERPQKDIDEAERMAKAYARDARKAFIAIRKTARATNKIALSALGFSPDRAETLLHEADRWNDDNAARHPKAVPWLLPYHGAAMYTVSHSAIADVKAQTPVTWAMMSKDAKNEVISMAGLSSQKENVAGHENDEFPYFANGKYYVQAHNMSHDFKRFFAFDASANRYVWRNFTDNCVVVIRPVPKNDTKHLNFVHFLPEMDSRDTTPEYFDARPAPKNRRERRAAMNRRTVPSIKENLMQYCVRGPPVDMALAAASWAPAPIGFVAKGLLAATKGVGLVHKADDALTNVDEVVRTVGPALLDVTDRATTVLDGIDSAISNLDDHVAVAMAPAQRAIKDTAYVVEDAVSAVAPKAVEVMADVSTAANAIETTMTSLSVDARRALNSVDRVCAQMSDVVGATQPVIEEVARQVDVFKNMFGWVPQNVDLLRIVQDVIVDCLIAYSTSSWPALGAGVLRFITNITGVTLLDIGAYAANLATIIKDWFNPPVTTQAPQQTESPMSRYVGCIASIIASAFGVTAALPNWKPSSVVWAAVKSAASSLAVFRFVTATFDILLDFTKWMFGIQSPEADALAKLDIRREDIEKFVHNSRCVMDEANARMRRTPTFRNLAWATALQASQIQQLIAKCPVGANMGQLNKSCSDVIRHVSDHMSEMSCSPVRYEPFMLTIEGDPGIGKSFFADQLINDLTKDLVDNRGGLPVYTRNPAQIYWDGYADQPIIKYDDWMNSRDPEVVRLMVGEMYALKTTAIFAPHMAAIEEKKISGNPVLVVMLTNKAYPTSAIATVSSDPNAVLRRRDLIVRASLTPKAEAMLKVLKSAREPDNQPLARVIEELAKHTSEPFPHLEFRCYKNGMDETLLPRVYTYTQLCAFTQVRHTAYFNREHANYTRRLDQMMDTMTGKLQLPVINFADPFETFYRIRKVSGDARSDRFLSEQCDFVVQNLHRIPGVAIQPLAESELEITAEAWDFYDIFMSTMAISADFLLSVLATPLAAMRNAFEKLWRSSHTDGTQGPCSRCKEVKALRSGCGAGHFLCELCVTVNGACIPSCTHTSNLKVVKRTDGLMFAMLKKATDGVANATAAALDVMSKIEEFTGRTPEAWIAIMAGIATGCGPLMVAGAANPHMKVRPAPPRGADHSVYTWSVNTEPCGKKVLRVTGEPVAQMDTGEPDDEHAASHSMPRSDTPGLTPVINLPEIEKLTIPDTTVLFCLHKELVKQPNASYVLDGSKRAWKVSVTTDHMENWAGCSPRACGIGDCPFLDKEKIKEWGLKHLDLKRGAYAADYRALATGPNPDALARIPQMFWPPWYKPGAPIDGPPENWWTLFEGAFTKLSNAMYVLTAGAAVVAAVVAGYRAFSWIAGLGASMLMAQNESPDVHDGRTSVASTISRLSRSSRKPRFDNRPRAEAPNVVAAVADKVAANYMCIRITQMEGHLDVMCLGLAGKMAIFPRHYFPEIERAFAKGRNIYLFPPGKFTAITPPTAIVYAFDPTDFTYLDYVDMVVMKTPQSIPMFKDIRKYFATEADLLDQPLSARGMLVRVPCRTNYRVVHSEVNILGYRESIAYTDSEGNKIDSADVLVYDAAQSGMCGSMLLLNNTQRPIVSMHVAGNSMSKGYGAIFTSEMAYQKADVLVAEMEIPELPQIEEGNQMIWDTEAIHVVGQVATNEKVFQPSDTKILPSHLFDIYAERSEYAPVILSRGDPRYVHDRTPLWHGVRKHGVITKDWPSLWTKEAAAALHAMVYQKMKPLLLQPTRLSPEQAVVGFDHKFYDPIKLETSAGYPWCLHRADKSKKSWVEVTRNSQDRIVGAIIDPVLLSVMSDNERKRRAGIVPAAIFSDNLKDEKRHVQKVVKVGGTRVVCASPMDYTLAVRQNFLHFCAAMMQHRFEVMSAVGINVYSGEWYELASLLTQRGQDHIIELDYSNFGPGFNANVAEAALGIMIRWTMDNVVGVDEKELWSIAMSCINSVHIAGQTVYHQVAGSPSGAAFTTIINSIVNQIYIMVAWKQMTGRPWNEFRRYVQLVVYGDDLIMSVEREDIRAVWNAQTITAWFSQYGIATTTSDKQNAVTKPFKTLAEATFLKRGFTLHPTRPLAMLAPLDKRVIYSMLAYIRKSQNNDVMMKANILQALMEAHAWGPKFFDELSKEIRKGLIHTRVEPPMQEWGALDNKWADGELFCDEHWPVW